MDTVTTHIVLDDALELGEGATYHPGTDTAWWFDIVGRKLFEHRIDAGTTKAHDLPFMASALAFVDDARQLVAAEDGLYLRDVATGALTLHVPLEADNPATRSNDGRAHPSGAFWIGTMGRNGERGCGAIYHYFKGEIRTLYERVSIPNSICFSPDARTAYFVDTKENLLNRVAVDPQTGLPAGEPQVLYDHSGHGDGLDGAVTDAEGVIYAARWGGGCIEVIAPDGQPLRSLRVCASRPTCPAFVGVGADRLLVTTAWQGMSAERRIEDPNAGKTFILDAATKGKFEPRVVIA